MRHLSPTTHMLQFGYGRGVHRSGRATQNPLAPHDPPRLVLDNVCFVRDARTIIDRVSLTIGLDEHWVVLGKNGSGKTTLLRIAALYEHPSTGRVEVLGETLGHTDVRRLRRRVGYSSAALASRFRDGLIAHDVVMTARYAALEPWWHRYDDADRSRAQECLDRFGVGARGGQTWASLSSGEQQRVMLARTLMTSPAVVVLDEPASTLDLGGREELVAALSGLLTQTGGPGVLMVSHHLDEIPPEMSHVLLLKDGGTLASGPIDETLTSDTLSECFEFDLTVERRGDGRFSAWARPIR